MGKFYPRFRVFTMLLVSCLAVIAQDSTGRIVGTVTDAQGAVVSGAKITVTNVETGVARSAVTSTDGQYQVLQLPIGTYRAAAEQAGFRKGSVLRKSYSSTRP